MTKPVSNRESVEAFKVAEKNYSSLMAGKAGGYYFNDNFNAIHIHLPGGNYCCLPLDGSRGWQWNGNQDKPTITPSIKSYIEWGPEREEIELWHGYMRAGRLESC